MSETPPSPWRVLVTGASGYIGANLVKRLVAQGHDVHIVVRQGSSTRLIASELAALTVHVHDGSTQSMLDIVGAARPHTVFHLASLFLAQHRASDVEALITSNVLFSTQLVEAMAAHGVTDLINTGTSWQHYEGQDYLPVNLYAATKQAFEAVLAYYTEAQGLKVSSLILFDTYGPHDPRAKLMALLWKTALTQQPISMSPGEQQIDLVYIDDVIDAFLMAARLLPGQAQGHRRYGVSSGHPLPLKDLVAAFERTTGLSLPIDWGGRPYRPREVMTTWVPHECVPGWRARTPLEAGVLMVQPVFDQSKAYR